MKKIIKIILSNFLFLYKKKALIYELIKRDIRARFKKSIIGPGWITISSLIYISVVTFIFSNLFNMDDEYIIYITSGVISWQYINSSISSSSGILRSSKGWINNTSLPSFFFIVKDSIKQIFFFFFSLILFPIIFILFSHEINFNFLFFLIGLLILFINLFLISFSISYLSTVYNWLSNIIPPIMQLSFYICPIIWMPSRFNISYVSYLDYYPLSILLSLVRNPLLNNSINIGLTLLFTSVNLIICILVYRKFNKKIRIYI